MSVTGQKPDRVTTVRRFELSTARVPSLYVASPSKAYEAESARAMSFGRV